MNPQRIHAAQPVPVPDRSTGPATDDLAFTGRCEVDLERAVVRYRAVDEGRFPGGRSEDLGVGVVLGRDGEGRGARSPSRVLDFGSGVVRETELSPPLVILGWLFTRPYRDLVGRALSTAGEAPSSRSLPLAGPLLTRLPLSPETRPIFLRAGFRDVTLDLDPHESISVRLSIGAQGISRIHLDYDRATLVVRTGRTDPDPGFVHALSSSFPAGRVDRVVSGAGQGTIEFHLTLPEPTSVGEVRELCSDLRRGLLHLMALHDPARHLSVLEQLRGFGARDLLGQLASPPGGVREAPRRERVHAPAAPLHHSGRIH